MAQTATHELIGGMHVSWKDISLHANSKACTPWAQHITGTHSKYGVDGDWLDKTTIDGTPHFDVSEREPGDIIKVSGASHSNKKNAYYRIHAVGDELVVERINESAVISELEGGRDDLTDLRTQIQTRVAEMDDVETLENIKEILEE